MEEDPWTWKKWCLVICRCVFIGGKCLTMIYKDVVYAVKFKKTYKTWKQFEIIYFIASAVLIAVVLPVIFIKEINSLFYCFLANSVLRYSISHMLFMRTNIAMHEPVSKIRCLRISHIIKLCFLLSFVIAPLFGNPRYLFCEPDREYPIAFLLIFVTDSIMACWDLVVLLFTPTNMRKAFKRKLEQRKGNMSALLY